MEGTPDMPQMETLPARTWPGRTPAPDPLTRAESVAAIRATIDADGFKGLPLLRIDFTFPGERFDVSGTREGWIVGHGDEWLVFEDEDGECATIDWDDVDDLRPADLPR